MNWLMVGAVAGGGALGSVARYFAAGLLGRTFGTAFPWGTLAVNIVGSFAMGMVVELIALKFSASQELRAFLAVGVLGGFTTFSSFSLDTAVLFQRGEFGHAMVYVLASVMGGLFALFAALYLVRQVIA